MFDIPIVVLACFLGVFVLLLSSFLYFVYDWQGGTSNGLYPLPLLFELAFAM